MAMDWAVIGSSTALAALMVGLFRWLRADIASVRNELDGLRGDLSAVAQRTARLEGMLGVLQTAVLGKAPDPDAA